jgi:hypothetical protein
MIRVVEGSRAAVERSIVELPLRRCDPPDQLREVAPIFLVTSPAALGGEVVLVPPLQLGRRRSFSSGMNWRHRNLWSALDPITTL